MAVSVFYRSSAVRKMVLEVIPTISFLCAFIVIVVVCTLLFFNTENDFYNYIFIVIVLGVNGPLVFILRRKCLIVLVTF